MIIYLKKHWRRFVSWLKLAIGLAYDPYFNDNHGMRYAKLPKGMILRLEGKKRHKRRRKVNELREFFKK